MHSNFSLDASGLPSLYKTNLPQKKVLENDNAKYFSLCTKPTWDRTSSPSAAISRIAEIGPDVNFVSGGNPIPNLNVGRAKFHQLPPVRSLDRNFKVLVDETGREIDDRWRQNRCSKLLNLFEETKPSMILTELFPFG